MAAAAMIEAALRDRMQARSSSRHPSRRASSEVPSPASEASTMRARNAAMERDVASLEQELKLVKQPAYTAQMARAFMLGTPREIPFSLDPNAPALPADAPGSAG